MPTGFSIGAIPEYVKSGWGTVTDAIGDGLTTVHDEMTKAAVFAERVFAETSIAEKDGIYTISGPFASKFTFSWRELAMIGGIVTSVIFATIAFFTGHIILGCVFTIYTILLIFGAYWLSEWAKNLTAEQIHTKAREVGIASMALLQEVVAQFTRVLSGHGDVYSQQIADLLALDARLEGGTGRLETAVTILGEEVVDLPGKLNPFVEQMGVALGESRGVRDELRVQNLEYQRQNRELGQQVSDARVILADLRGQITALGAVLATLRGEVEHLGEERGEITTQRQELQVVLGGLTEVVERATALVANGSTPQRRRRSVSFTPTDPASPFASGASRRPLITVREGSGGA